MIGVAAALTSGCALLVDFDVGVRGDDAADAGPAVADSVDAAIDAGVDEERGEIAADAAPEAARFVYVDTPRRWGDAAAECEALGGHLATVDSPDQNALVAALIGDAPVWIGASDQVVENLFAWVDGTTWSYQNWGLGEPTNLNGTEDCVRVDGAFGARWNDWGCSAPLGFVCERE